MRSNGLTAASYTPIADLDPSIVGSLFETLKEHGVAAYATPVEPSSLGIFDRPEFRTDVRDRLYVDAAAADIARTLVTALTQEIDTTSDDLAWAQIVSGYDQPLRDEATPWPATEDLTEEVADDATGDSAVVGYDDQAVRRTPPDDDSTRHSAKVRAPGEDDEDGFVPPTPPPLPRLEPRQQVAWLGVVGGPLLLLVSVLFGVHLPGWLSVLAVVGFVGGFVGLVVMMGGRDDDEDSGWDDGAVV